MIVALLLCIASFFPIGEKDLLEPEARWPHRKQVENDTLREAVLRKTGYQDSTGHISSRLTVWLLDECEGDTTYGLFLVNGLEGDRDDAVWLVRRYGHEILDRTMVAVLQTSCESTFLRASYMSADNTIEMKQLNHVFDCANDAYLRTDTLAGSRIRVTGTGIEDIEEIPTTPAGE